MYVRNKSGHLLTLEQITVEFLSASNYLNRIKTVCVSLSVYKWKEENRIPRKKWHNIVTAMHE